MIKAIIFDFDGVLVESVDIKTRAFAKLFESYGKDISGKVVDYHIRNSGVSRFEKFKYIYKEILNEPISEEIFNELCNRFSELVVDEVVKAPYVKGAKEFLDSYAEIYNCFIASATPQNEIEEIAKRRGISHYFKGIYGSPLKKAVIVKEIIDAYHYTSDDIVYIGDALSDYEAAKANGIRFIARVSGGEQTFFDIECAKVNDMVNINKILEKLFEGNLDKHGV